MKKISLGCQKRFGDDAYCVRINLHLLVDRQRTPLLLFGFLDRSVLLRGQRCGGSGGRILGQAVNDVLKSLLFLFLLCRHLGYICGCGWPLPGGIAGIVIVVHIATRVSGHVPASRQGIAGWEGTASLLLRCIEGGVALRNVALRSFGNNNARCKDWA